MGSPVSGGYGARICVIDTQTWRFCAIQEKDAVFHPEMEAFAKPYGFKWMAYEKVIPTARQAQRGSFWTVETSFLPGRTFESN